jgi:hypothetical protein
MTVAGTHKSFHCIVCFFVCMRCNNTVLVHTRYGTVMTNRYNDMIIRLSSYRIVSYRIVVKYFDPTLRFSIQYSAFEPSTIKNQSKFFRYNQNVVQQPFVLLSFHPNTNPHMVDLLLLDPHPM